eukprot:1158173-Pelagomonas_calceolata.AAC.5
MLQTLVRKPRVDGKECDLADRCEPQRTKKTDRRPSWQHSIPLKGKTCKSACMRVHRSKVLTAACGHCCKSQPRDQRTLHEHSKAQQRERNQPSKVCQLKDHLSLSNTIASEAAPDPFLSCNP